MDIADLSDTSFNFTCNFEPDTFKYWDFYLTGTVDDYEYGRSMNYDDIKCLRNNCKRILEATDGLITGGC
jgi:hypothetical protein